jgi:hypothetical protein
VLSTPLLRHEAALHNVRIGPALRTRHDNDDDDGEVAESDVSTPRVQVRVFTVLTACVRVLTQQCTGCLDR